jgi:hypothetical protein
MDMQSFVDPSNVRVDRGHADADATVYLQSSPNFTPEQRAEMLLKKRLPRLAEAGPDFFVDGSDPPGGARVSGMKEKASGRSLNFPQARAKYGLSLRLRQDADGRRG